MGTIFRSFIDNYNWMMYDFADPRTKDYFLVQSPYPGLAILFLYYYFVTKWGPELMRNRKPLNVNGLVQVYNLVQIVLCFYIFIRATMKLYGPNGAYSLSCQPLDYADTEFNQLVNDHCWLYFMLKILDLFDTVFFVLRKKNSQVSGLHLYHHMGMFALVWVNTKYIPGGQMVFVGVTNCFVHGVMYSYYLATNRYPQYNQTLWWKLKKYVTQLQMLQFLLCSVYIGQVLFRQNCTYPRLPVLILLPNFFIMIYLFSRFYRKTYLSKEKTN